MLRNHERLAHLIAIVATLVFVLPGHPAAGQTAAGGDQAARPGSPTGAATPGMPRDPRGAAQTGNARVRGRVVAAQTGAPLRRAQVSLLAVGGPGRRTATTDGDGRYEFADLPAGFYNLNASKAGFVGLQYGQQRPTEIGRPINVADGQRLDGIDFSLPRGAVIAVRITDDFGDPLAGAQVQVQRYQYGQDGQRRLMMAGTASFGMNATDDRGELRMYGLTPGEYFVSATYRNQLAMPGANANDTNEGFSPTFYPGTVSATEAQGVSVVIGEEVSVQFALTTARLARISGTVVDSQGRPAVGAQVQIMSLQGGTVTGGGGGGQVAPDGTFSLAGVAPGEHSLEVRPQFRPGGPGPSEEFGSLPIVVSGADITGLRIVTGRGATISGRVVFEGSSPRTNPNNPNGPNILRVFANQTDQTRFMGAFPSQDPLTNGTIQDNGTFQIAGMSGRVFLTVSTPGMWAQKSVTLDGQDVTDEPIDLTGKQSITGIVIRMTDKLTRVTGRVSDARAESPRECWLVFQPAEQKDPLIVSRWLRLARCTAKGSFETRGLRPGRYLVTAIESMEQGRQFVPEFREQLRRGAQEFSVNEGGSVTLDLKLTPGL